MRVLETVVTFCGLDRDVAKKERNLLQFAAGGAAEPSATSTEIPFGNSSRVCLSLWR
jgi:hypothetical protein